MSPSTKPALTFAVTFAVLLLLGAYLLRNASETGPASSGADIPSAQTEVSSPPTVDYPTQRQASRAVPRKSKAAAEITSGVRVMPIQTPAVLPPLTGYTVDRFDNWTAIPPGYRADGVTLRDSALTLEGDAASTGPRTGILVSPPLPLRSPALSAPVQPRVEVPEGAEIMVEISLSEDGSQWTPWARLPRYATPDGKRVRPAFQASLSTAQLRADAPLTTATASAIAGPAIKYRLTLTSSGILSPSISDIRIWKQEYQ